MELQLLDRQAFVKLQQEKIEDAFSLLRESELIARSHSLEVSIAEIVNKIRNLEDMY